MKIYNPPKKLFFYMNISQDDQPTQPFKAYAAFNNVALI